MSRKQLFLNFISCLEKEAFDKLDKKNIAGRTWMDPFRTPKPPPLEDYMLRFDENIDKLHAKNQEDLLSQSSFVITLALILRLSKRFDVSKDTIHRLFAATMTLSCKFCDDYYLKNSCLASMLGLNLKELNQLEGIVFKLLRFDIMMNEKQKEFETVKEKLMMHQKKEEKNDEKKND